MQTLDISINIYNQLGLIEAKYIYIYFFFFLIQFNVPFKIISLIETSQSIGGAKSEYPGNIHVISPDLVGFSRF